MKSGSRKFPTAEFQFSRKFCIGGEEIGLLLNIDFLGLLSISFQKLDLWRRFCWFVYVYHRLNHLNMDKWMTNYRKAK